ncbi:hypothetical protein JS77_10195 [Synergistes jonesii]|nr:hypothetical protein JS77_10195 [Synergistes jonesii]
MTTLRIPPNIPKPTLEEMRACPIIKQFDDLGIWFGINPPCIDAREMVLHISDTPQTMYHYLRRALRRLKPAWIVHTGDFVDNVKLEKRPGLIDLYRKKYKVFFCDSRRRGLRRDRRHRKSRRRPHAPFVQAQPFSTDLDHPRFLLAGKIFLPRGAHL